jgi:FAS-associated factor 2
MSDQRNLLSSQQQETLQTFQDISQITDDGLAIQVLQQNNWNLDSAVNQFVQDQSGNVSISNATDNVNNNQPRNRLNRTAASTTTNTTNNSNNNNNTNQNTILDVAFLPLRWLFQVRPVSMNPNMDTANFIDEYGRKFGNIHPTFQNCSYQSAVANAFQASKFLLVYLHSPIHEDTNKFCRQVFASPEVVNLADANLLTWTGNIWHPEAYGLSTQLKASAFPFVALLVCQSNRVVQIAERIQGNFDNTQLSIQPADQLIY